MKVTDLRIGNYLRDGLTKELLRVTEITEAGFTTSVVDRSKYPLPDGWHAEPMPLTEEWLLKCGFVRVRESDFAITFHFPENDKFLFKIDLKSGYILWYLGVPIYIQHLHQLQNLYKYLSGGEELEVSL